MDPKRYRHHETSVPERKSPSYNLYEKNGDSCGLKRSDFRERMSRGGAIMIQYEIVHPGLAQTMVMVHGFSQSKEIFEAQVKHFGDRFRLVLIDLRGHGALSRAAVVDR